MPRCPVCFVPMTRTEEEGLRGHTCPSCFGHWMPAMGMLRRLRIDVQKAIAHPPTSGASAQAVPPPLPPPVAEASLADAVASGPADSPAADAIANAGGSEQSPLPDLAAIVAESNSKAPLRCPECEKIMNKDRYQQMIPVIVDRCKHCDRIWLDTGEFHLLRRLYLELATSTDPQIVQLREKVAAVSLEWQSRPTLSQSVARSTNDTGDFASLTLDVLFGMLRV